MRALSLALFICLWCFSEAPTVLAGTRAVVEDPAPIEEDLCKGWDGYWHRPGAKECQPQEAEEPPTASTEPADAQEETDAAGASEASGSPHGGWFLAAVAIAVISLAAVVIAAVSRTSGRAFKATLEPETQPPDTAVQNQPGEGEAKDPPPVATESPSLQQATPPTPPLLAEQAPAQDVTPAPAPTSEEEAVDIHDQPVLDEAKARLVTVWTGPPRTVEFTCQDEDGERHRKTVDVSRISRDPQDGGWYLHGFCHLWREEQDFDAASIVTKILYKSRRWNVEDWIASVTGKDARDV
jgi:hypothetical protein